jgi:hypothetical protein
MRSFRALILLSLVVSGGEAALAQGDSAARARPDIAAPQETPEEVIVRGRRLADFRVEVELARERAYDIFNEINGDDDFDVHCVLEERTGTRMRGQVCRAQFEGRISSRAAKEYMSALKWVCPLGVTQDCIFSEASSGAISRAQGVEGEALNKRKELNQKIVRLANEDPRFGQAILDFYDASLRYEEERERPRERTGEP